MVTVSCVLCDVTSGQRRGYKELEQNQQEQFCTSAASQERIIRAVVDSRLPVPSFMYVCLFLMSSYTSVTAAYWRPFWLLRRRRSCDRVYWFVCLMAVLQKRLATDLDEILWKDSLEPKEEVFQFFLWQYADFFCRFWIIIQHFLSLRIGRIVTVCIVT